ncbi:LysR substrate-binding domain-containing protein [Aestuariibius sp. 2305UL40-4]|uniref:LysR substrate-binding domain-containing protein n=1 Tax=Aestuariibius violaceus TaxID=3234132 RepID=UPI00345EA88C
MIIGDLIDARILTELRNRGSFNGAARALRLPTTTVSRRIAKMEERAGLRLFDRTSRSVRITEAGIVAAGHATEMLTQAEAADLSIDNLRERPAGLITISTPVIFGQASLGPIMTGFLRRYPECAFSVDLCDRHVDLVEECVDVAIRIGPPEDDEIIIKPLGVVFAYLYRSAAHPAPEDADQLGGLPIGLLHPGFGQAPSLVLTSATGHERDIPVAPRLVAMNPWLLQEAALDSDLVVVLPEIVAREAVADGRLRRVLPGWWVRRAPVNLAFTSRRLMRPAVRAFVDYAAEEVPQRLDEEVGSGTP